ncbi:AmmeMemoRadiSam system protein A [Spirochaetia bacterium 38H-sp]|uniref:AmmeMemoRadiSam system protein A n=1 Tax=Rarispira pelagica TaxID=3141764 RepID=A0ABU9U8D1_9SPIR
MMQHTDKEKELLLTCARETIAAHLETREPRLPAPPERLTKEKCGAFVTLHKDGRLRGCIGRIIGDKPVWEVVKEVALESAFSDPRFPPLAKSELEHVELEISLLSPFFEIKPEEVVPGKHGLLIRCGFNQGLLLPQVATEYGWDRPTFLAHLCLKAGLPTDAWMRDDCTLMAFTAEVFSEKDFY